MAVKMKAKKQIQVKPKSKVSPEPRGCIYLLTNLTNGKQYVGQHLNVKTVHRRWNSHICVAFNTTDTRPLYRAIRKSTVCKRTNRLKNFIAEVIWTGPVSQLNWKETYYIKKLHTFIDDPKGNRGYNLTKGGDNGAKSLDTCKKISAYHTARFANPLERLAQSERIKAVRAANPMLRVELGNLMRGRPISAEHLAKTVAGNTGKKRSEQSRANLASGAHKRYSRIEEHTKTSEAALRRYEDEQEHVRSSERAKKMWARSDVRAKHLKAVEVAKPKQRAAALAYWARKRRERMTTKHAT